MKGTVRPGVAHRAKPGRTDARTYWQLNMPIFSIFILLIVLAPLPFGMVYAVTQAVFACLVMGLVVCYCVARLKQKKGTAVPLGWIRPEAVGFFLVLAWGVVQIGTFSPSAWHHPLWPEAGRALGLDIAGSIGLARGAGFEMLMRMLTYGAVFWLALQFGRDRKRAGQLLAAVILAAVVYSAYGLVIKFGGFGTVLWIERVSAERNVTGTFINRNNFATYVGFALLVLCGFYMAGFLKTLESGRRGRDLALNLLQQAFVRGAPQLAGMLILLTALFLTNSRAGVTATLAALVVLVTLMGPLRRMAGGFHRLLTLTVLAAVFGIFLLSGEGWIERLTATDLDREMRLKRYDQTWQAINHAPLTGYGAGSFQQAFPMFADERTVNSFKVHNDWLETMFELGIPAAAVWFLVLGGLGLRCLIGFFRRGRDYVYPAAGFCACVLVGIHSFVDFSLQIPAVAVTFAVILGVGVVQSRSSLEE